MVVVIIIAIVVALIIIGRLTDQKEKVYRDEYRKNKRQLRVALSRQEQLATLYFMYRMASVDGEFADIEKQDYILGLMIIMMMVDHKIEDAELTLIGETAFKIGMSRERVREISDQVMEMYAQSCQ